MCACCSPSHHFPPTLVRTPCCAIAVTASGVATQLNLVHYYREPTYVEARSDAFGSALTAISSSSDGVMDNVHTLRTQYAADIVAMIIDASDYCGLASMGPSPEKMFSVTKWSCATGYFSFGHEIGHNLGINHDRGTKDACIDPNDPWDGVVKPIDHLGSGPFTDLQECQGDCDSSSDCAGQLYCYFRDTGGVTPGCSGNGASDSWDYCSHPALVYGK